MCVALSDRLACVASFVRPGDRVVDVGTDHGYIPIWLIENKICDFAIASDIKKGPLDNARSGARRSGVEDKIRFDLAPGLRACREDEVDSVIIAGMGGETIANILSDAPWTKNGKRLILQPQSKIDEMRIWMGYNGYTISDAKLVYDMGRIYLVLLACGGELKSSTSIEELLYNNRDPLLSVYCNEKIKKLRNILVGLQRSAFIDNVRVDGLKREVEILTEIGMEAQLWRE